MRFRTHHEHKMFRLIVTNSDDEIVKDRRIQKLRWLRNILGAKIHMGLHGTNITSLLGTRGVRYILFHAGKFRIYKWRAQHDN